MVALLNYIKRCDELHEIFIPLHKSNFFLQVSIVLKGWFCL